MNNISLNYRNPRELKPYKKNPRINDQAVEAVKKSIQEFGFKIPMVIDCNDVVVCGHTRLKAALELGLQDVPCVVADDLTDEQIKAFRLADNGVSEIAEWDFDMLNDELSGIFDIDMSQFGFTLPDIFDDEEEESEDDSGYYGDERERTMNSMNLHDVDYQRLDGKYEMPFIKATDHIPDDLISFNYALNTETFEKGIHFYIDDYQFERLWNDPHMYLDRLSKFDCVLTPDFSLYTDMPIAMQIWNTYRSRLIGQVFQDYGITVIPTLSWCRPDSYEFCFDGIEEGGVVSVSTIGVKEDANAKKLWTDGMTEALRRLNPSCVVVYGGDIGYKFPCDVVYISNHNADRLKKGNVV